MNQNAATFTRPSATDKTAAAPGISTGAASELVTPPGIHPSEVLGTLKRHLLVDGFPIVVDIDRSRGSWLHDAATGKKYLDLFMFFASAPIGFNHPRLIEPRVIAKLARSALMKPSNSDFYTVEMAEFVDTLEKTAMPAELPHLFLISGGALGVENALKAAFDWKVRKNFADGYRKERGTRVMHFEQAFHGRTGYTLSLTNTADPRKTKYFPKFDWPRMVNPKITFPLEGKNLDAVIDAEKLAIAQMEHAFVEHRDDIAAIIIEPIQGEGGDNHFRPEFFAELRRLADENEAMLIFDEVQTGVGLTGRMWAYQHLGVVPDIICFGKKMQICGMHGLAPHRRGEEQRLQRVEPDQLDLGRQPRRHGPRLRISAHHSRREPGCQRRGQGQETHGWVLRSAGQVPRPHDEHARAGSHVRLRPPGWDHAGPASRGDLRARSAHHPHRAHRGAFQAVAGHHRRGDGRRPQSPERCHEAGASEAVDAAGATTDEVARIRCARECSHGRGLPSGRPRSLDASLPHAASGRDLGQQSTSCR